MDISTITELRAQLRSAAIAGADLISENFRLKRAVEAFAPLKNASPVFGKIYELSEKLVSGGCENAAGTLLDALSLTDSVMTTLAKVDVEGEAKKLEVTDYNAKIIDAPYSRLSRLINALTGSGGGQYNIVYSAKEEKSELFEDYRVKPALVKCLGASYSELADTAYDIIEGMGEDMLPLLMEGFDPDGKKETIKRIMLIDNIAKEKANDFYLKNIPLSEKNVKKLLVRALRHDVSNADRLIEFTKTEKGAIKDEAFYSLARLDCDKARAFFEEMEKDKPQETLEYLRFSRSDWSSRLAAKIGNRLFDNNDGGKYKTDGFGVHIDYVAFSGKTGKDVEDFLRRVCYKKMDEQERQSVFDLVDIALKATIAMTSDKGICDLTLELAKKFPSRCFAEAEIYAMLIGTDDCTKLLKKRILETKEYYKNDRNKSVAMGSAITQLKNIHLVNGEYVLSYKLYDSRNKEPSTHELFNIPLNQPIREKWIDMLIDCDWYQADLFLEYLFDKSDKKMYEKVKDHYIKTVLNDKSATTHMWMMERCGMHNIEGLVVEYFKRQQKNEKIDPINFVLHAPGDQQYRYKEAAEVILLIRSGKMKAKFDVDKFEEWVNSHLR